MPYVYKEGIVKYRNRGIVYKELDVSKVRLDKLYSEYIDVYLKLTHTNVDGEFVVKLSDLNQFITNTTVNVDTFLLLNDNRTLPTLNIDMKLSKKSSLYVNAWNSILSNIKPTIIGTHPSTDWEPGVWNDLLLSSDSGSDINYNSLFETTLVTVNGLLHRTGSSEYGIYVKDAAKLDESRIVKANSIGLLSFEHIGKLELIDIDSTMLSNGTSDSYSDNCLILLNRDLSNKTLLISMCGFLHALDDFYSVINPEIGLIKFDFTKYNIVTRHYMLMNKLTNLNLANSIAGDDDRHILLDSLVKSNEYIDSLFDMSQTFAILLDAEVSVELQALEDTDMGGVYVTYCKHDPIVVGTMLDIKEHSFKERDGRLLIYFNDYNLNNYLYNTIDYTKNMTIRDNRDPSSVVSNDTLYSLNIIKRDLT